MGNMFVLTWLIGPHSYGLFVTAIGLTAVPATLVRAGLDTSLIRVEHAPGRGAFDTACTAILGFSFLAMLAGAAAVPVLSYWYRSREFVPAFLAVLVAIPL